MFPSLPWDHSLYCIFPLIPDILFDFSHCTEIPTIYHPLSIFIHSYLSFPQNQVVEGQHPLTVSDLINLLSFVELFLPTIKHTLVLLSV